MKKKSLTLILTLALAVGAVVGGTLAWLTASTDDVVNTFTTSDIDIKLEETTGNEYKMVPGCTVDKNPTVTVLEGSEECYLFVKLKKSSNFDSFMTCDMAEGWTALNDTDQDGVADDGVYYRIVEETDMDESYSVLKDDKVTVKDDVTREMMKALKTETYPTLTVTAYASQYVKSNAEEFTPEEAWKNISTASN